MRSLALILCALLTGCATSKAPFNTAITCPPAPTSCPALGIDDSDRVANPAYRRSTAKHGAKTPLLSYDRWGSVAPPTDEARLLIETPDGRKLLIR